MGRRDAVPGTEVSKRMQIFCILFILPRWTSIERQGTKFESWSRNFVDARAILCLSVILSIDYVPDVFVCVIAVLLMCVSFAFDVRFMFLYCA